MEIMKRFIVSCLALLAFGTVLHPAAANWWEMQSICKPDNTTCYKSPMGRGFEVGFWDTGAGCWGMKLVCGEALIEPQFDSEPKSKSDLAGNVGISTDFDTNVLFGGCFGARKITGGGSMTLINGQEVKIWCPGILESPDAVDLPNGEAQPNPQPDCEFLADREYVDILNGKCWGKKFPRPEYTIVCENGFARLFIMNGAQEITPIRSSSIPATQSAANAIFDDIQRAASERRSKHFR